MSPVTALGLVLLLGLVLYALLAGADFGGGVWDLLAAGPRAPAQRAAVARAIGPIWEANHVWMVLVVVVLFSAFSPAYALVMTALNVPVSLVLVGIVLRGSSFVFRKYDPAGFDVSGWGRVFAVSSTVTPVFLGVVLGTLSTPGLTMEGGRYTGGFFGPWLQPFPWVVGLFALVLFAFLAATYLTAEVEDPDLARDFRNRALAAAAAAALLAAAVWILSEGAAPEVYGGLGAPWGLAARLGAAAALAATVGLLWRGRWLAARVGAGATVALVVAAWGAALHPWIVPGVLTLEAAAAPAPTLRWLLRVLAAGTVILAPCLVYLYRTFRPGRAGPPGRGR